MSERAGSTLAVGAAAAGERSLSRSSRARLENRLLLCAVCGLVFLVSLPRLRSIALAENELDAVRTLELLGRELERGSAAGLAPARIGALLAEPGALRRRLGDLELFADGRFALRHGYLFELQNDPRAEPLLCAWPLQRGSTGRAAFLWRPGEGVSLHSNPDGAGRTAWSGLERPPTLHPASAAEWRRVTLSRSRRESL